MTRITRVEVIDENGRSYVNWEDDNNVSWQFQDDGRTLKVFVNKVKPKSPVEEAYKDWWGQYPETGTWDSFDDKRWQGFQAGYEFAYAISTAKEVMEKVQEEQKWDAVRESVKWCEEHREESLEDYLTPRGPQGPVGPGPGPKGVIVGYEPTPHTPEQTEKSLRTAFGKAQQTEKWKEIQKLIGEEDMVEKELTPNLQKIIDKMVEERKGQNLTDLIYDWWEDVFTTNSNDDMETSINDLVERIKHWLPKEQSAAGSQNAYVECSVEGFNDCINKIRRKLR